MAKRDLQLIAIHLITLHNILEYMQIAIIQTEAADFVKINFCVILKTFGHDCRLLEPEDLSKCDIYWKLTHSCKTGAVK